jgi:hypothetical protein
MAASAATGRAPRLHAAAPVVSAAASSYVFAYAAYYFTGS